MHEGLDEAERAEGRLPITQAWILGCDPFTGIPQRRAACESPQPAQCCANNPHCRSGAWRGGDLAMYRAQTSRNSCRAAREMQVVRGSPAQLALASGIPWPSLSSVPTTFGHVRLAVVIPGGRRKPVRRPCWSGGGGGQPVRRTPRTPIVTQPSARLRASHGRAEAGRSECPEEQSQRPGLIRRQQHHSLCSASGDGSRSHPVIFAQDPVPASSVRKAV